MTLKISKILLPLSAIFLAWALPMRGAIPVGAESVTPLKVGERAPTAIVKTLDSADFDLGRAFATKPTVPEIPGGAGGHWLPVPSIFIIGSDGIIKFVEFNANYRIRPPTEEILKAASQVRAGSN